MDTILGTGGGAGVLNRLPATLSNDFPRLSELFYAPLRAIYEDAEGALWVGTGKGLNVIRQQPVAAYAVTNGLAGNNVTTICRDQANNIWIGTDGGLSRWTGAGFINPRPRRAWRRITSMPFTRMPRRTCGLPQRRWCESDQISKITNYDAAGTFSTMTCSEILEDDSGHLWMSSRRGLFRVAQ